jgi:hypothetical protein
MDDPPRNTPIARGAASGKLLPRGGSAFGRSLAGSALTQSGNKKK